MHKVCVRRSRATEWWDIMLLLPDYMNSLRLGDPTQFPASSVGNNYYGVCYRPLEEMLSCERFAFHVLFKRKWVIKCFLSSSHHKKNTIQESISCKKANFNQTSIFILRNISKTAKCSILAKRISPSLCASVKFYILWKAVRQELQLYRRTQCGFWSNFLNTKWFLKCQRFRMTIRNVILRLKK